MQWNLIKKYIILKLEGKKQQTGFLNLSVLSTKREKLLADFKRSIIVTVPKNVGADQNL